MELAYIVLVCWVVVVLWWLMGAWVGTTNPAHVCMPHISVHMFFLIMAAGENESNESF